MFPYITKEGYAPKFDPRRVRFTLHWTILGDKPKTVMGLVVVRNFPVCGPGNSRRTQRPAPRL